MENNKDIKLSKPKLKTSLKDLKKLNTLKNKNTEKNQYLDSFFSERFMTEYFKKRELKIKN
jgi:hypothetical protein